jgi:PadR family transcriptional regulator, regulatory protein PadR
MTADQQATIQKQTYQLVFDLKRGFLQFVILHLISQQQRYAYEIKDEILKITSGTFDIDRNNLYKKLRSLEQQGFLKSQLEHSQHGADRKYYSITPFGKRLFQEMYQLLIPVMGSLHKRIKQP